VRVHCAGLQLYSACVYSRDVKKRYSAAVVALAQAASAIGLPVSPREIERWLQARLIPQPERTYPGRGSRAAYSKRAAAQAAEIQRLLHARWHLDEVAVPLFLSGYEVGEETVKRAFKAHVARARRVLIRRAPGAETLTVAEAAAKTLLRSMRGEPRLARWRERVRGMDESTGAILESAAINFLHVLLAGEPASEEGLDELFVASGITTMIRRMSEVLGEDISVDELRVLLPKLEFTEYERLVDEFTLEELREAHQVMSECVDAAVPLITLAAATHGFDIPKDLPVTIAEIAESTLLFGLPLAVWMLREHAEGAAEVMSALRANMTKIRASVILLEYLPPAYWRFLGKDGEAALEAASEEERVEVLELARQAFATDERLQALNVAAAAEASA
jgi:hypothetical protein